jgi:flavin-dependent dehydrogenase
VLEQFDLGQWVCQQGATTTRWLGSLGGQRIELPLPSGVAMSRERLDAKLLAAAEEAGVKVWMPVLARVDQVGADSVSAVLEWAEGNSETEQYSAVVIASGLNASGSQRLLPWIQKPNGPFGASFFAESDCLPGGVIHMACDDDGYVGMVRLEDDRIDIAAALAAGSEAAGTGSAMERIHGILERSELRDWQFIRPTPIMTTPPLRRRRIAGAGRIVAIGDASGYVEPFTGEGMTWGMMSAVAAGDLIAARSDDLSGLGQAWCRELAALLRSKRLACRALTSALRSPLARRAIAKMLAQWPGMAAPLLHHLNRPSPGSFA